MRIGSKRFEAPHPVARLVPLAALCVFVLVLALIAWRDAVTRREADRRGESVRANAARVAGPEIALHSASRWLRHPTRSEPWAASADGPALLDVDPAGALAPPPRDVLRAGWPAVRVSIARRGR